MIFRYTILYVADVKTSLDFYTRAFGLSQAFLHESGDYGELLTGETKLAFSAISLMETLGKTVSKDRTAAPAFDLTVRSRRGLNWCKGSARWIGARPWPMSEPPMARWSRFAPRSAKGCL